MIEARTAATKPGLVSTIIPVFNRPEWLREAVESVLSQTYRPIEIVIVNDGSTDSVPSVADALAAQHADKIHVIHNPNQGAGPSRESGRRVAKGEFIQYLDSDDRLLPRKFEVMVQALRDNPQCGAAYGYIRLCPEGEEPLPEPHKWSGRTFETLFPHLLVDRWWNTDCPLWRRSVCDAVGPWSNLRYSQDWEYDARAGALGVKLVHCHEFVCEQRHHALNRQTGSGKWLEPKDQVRFFCQLHHCACRVGVTMNAPEMQHFSRWVFLQARTCGAMGDSDSAQALFELAQEACVRPDRTMRLVRRLSSILGWKLIGRICMLRDRLAGQRVGRYTQVQSWMK